MTYRWNGMRPWATDTVFVDLSSGKEHIPVVKRKMFPPKGCTFRKTTTTWLKLLLICLKHWFLKHPKTQYLTWEPCPFQVFHEGVHLNAYLNQTIIYSNIDDIYQKTAWKCLDSANFENFRWISPSKKNKHMQLCQKNRLNCWADRVWNYDHWGEPEFVRWFVSHPENMREIWTTSKPTSVYMFLVLCSRFSECNTIQQTKTQKIWFLLPLQIPPTSIFDLVSFLLMGSNSAITDPSDLHPVPCGQASPSAHV